MTFKATVYQGISPQGETRDFGEWENFVQWLKESTCHKAPDKKGGLSFSLVTYRNEYRLAENEEDLYYGVVLDFDHIDDGRMMFRALDRYEYYAYTTWTSTSDQERWRVIMPLADPVSHEEVVRIIEYLERRVGQAATIDKCSKGRARLWFAMHYKQARPQDHYHPGIRISSSRLLTVNFSGVKSATMPGTIEEGERNNLLASYLRGQNFAGCPNEAALREEANEWNHKLADPLPRREVISTVRGAWRWWTQTPEGLERKRIAMGAIQAQMEFAKTDWDTTAKAREEVPLIGDHYLYPGLTVLSGKAKSGKTRLLWDILVAMQEGKPLWRSGTFPGFSTVKTKCAILAMEDNALSLKKMRLHERARGVTLYLHDNLEAAYKVAESRGIDGFRIFESLVEQLYNDGVRLIAIDPLSQLENVFHFGRFYPGSGDSENIHSREFSRLRYFQRLCDMYAGLSLVLVFHHGKNKIGHDLMDPQDMIAGTSGIHAAAVNIFALVRPPNYADLDPKTNPNVFHLGGRLSPSGNYSMEMDDQGMWMCTGEYVPPPKKSRGTGNELINAALELGAMVAPVNGGKLAEILGITVRQVVNLVARADHPGYKFITVLGKNGGYKLVKK